MKNELLSLKAGTNTNICISLYVSLLF